MIRLIAFDMDGTVLNDEKKILKETKEALATLKKVTEEAAEKDGRAYRIS